MSLSKLKPYRDLLYTLRTLPSLPTFRLAYRCIKLWAIQHGVYSTKFGFLGGVHITLMLSAIYKRIANGFGAVSAGDLITSFFHHYAHFEWANEMVYDSFFHKNVPRYHRSAREPMVVLGFHTPNSNIAHTSTVPGVQVLVKEFSTADARLSDPAVTWETFFRPLGGAASTCELTAGAASFLDTHESYAKIDINYWGRSLAKGKSLVGWLESRALSLVIGE
jgi:poly(A) polymerase Pap1